MLVKDKQAVASKVSLVLICMQFSFEVDFLNCLRELGFVGKRFEFIRRTRRDRRMYF